MQFMHRQVDVLAVEEMLEGASGAGKTEVPLVPRFPAPEDQHLQHPAGLVRVPATKVSLMVGQFNLAPLHLIERDLKATKHYMEPTEPVVRFG